MDKLMSRILELLKNYASSRSKFMNLMFKHQLQILNLVQAEVESMKHFGCQNANDKSSGVFENLGTV